MTQLGSSSSPVAELGSTLLRGISRRSSDRSSPPGANEITDIIPIDEFYRFDAEPDYGEPDHDDPDHDDPDFGDNWVFEGDTQELSAVDLGELNAALNDTDDLPTLLLASAGPSAGRARHGKHRRQPASAVKSRILVAAMAAGAGAAAAHAATHPSGTAEAQTVQPAQTVVAQHDSAPDGATGVAASRGMQMVTVKAAANLVIHNEELAKGMAYAQERAEREARLQQPLFVMPTRGIFTSNFGYRWGVLHGGIDIANSIGTPILAASDGVVIEAGPSAGYGMLVKLRHSDGTVTLYGHVNSTTVGVGEQVMAGDQIATMGNRGYSTGPHLHFEVLLGGTSRVDPTPWLAQRGVNFA